MIFEMLSEGTTNARTGRDLANYFKCDIRFITEQVERERRAGKPICANMAGENAGYFLAAKPEELEYYCKQLYRRGSELFKTRRALLETLDQMTSKQQEGNEE